MSCFSDLSACELKLHNYDVIFQFSVILTIDCKNTKSCYKRGQAYARIGEIQEALSDLPKASIFEPFDTTIKVEISNLLQTQGNQHEHVVSTKGVCS